MEKQRIKEKNDPNYEKTYKVNYNLDSQLFRSDFIFLKYPLNFDIFCEYKPSSLDIDSLQYLVRPFHTDILNDLLYPEKSYVKTEISILSHEDIDLIENIVDKNTLNTLRGNSNLSYPVKNKPTAVCTPPMRNPIDLFGNFKKISFNHPENNKLKPVKVFPVIPKLNVQTMKYYNGVFRDFQNDICEQSLLGNPPQNYPFMCFLEEPLNKHYMKCDLHIFKHKFNINQPILTAKKGNSSNQVFSTITKKCLLKMTDTVSAKKNFVLYSSNSDMDHTSHSSHHNEVQYLNPVEIFEIQNSKLVLNKNLEK